MKNNVQLQKLVLGASLTAVSIVIDVFFKLILNMPNFGLPFYAIPLILGGIILGPVYGGIMGFVGDAIGMLILGGDYLPLFVIAPIMWGVIPGLILHKYFNLFNLAWVVLLSYAVANISNTLAMLFYWPREVTMAWFILRLVLIPFNAVLIFTMVKDIHKKLLPFIERYTFVKEEIKA